MDCQFSCGTIMVVGASACSGLLESQAQQGSIQEGKIRVADLTASAAAR